MRTVSSSAESYFGSVEKWVPRGIEFLQDPRRTAWLTLGAGRISGGGARMRAQKEVRDEVLGRAGRYRVVHPKRRSPKEPSPLKVKEVWVEDRRWPY